MSDQIDDGGQAFPVPGSIDYHPGIGMTLRDYFAAAAMEGLVASCTDGGNVNPGAGSRFVFEVADAMIEARKSTTKDKTNE